MLRIVREFMEPMPEFEDAAKPQAGTSQRRPLTR